MIQGFAFYHMIQGFLSWCKSFYHMKQAFLPHDTRLSATGYSDINDQSEWRDTHEVGLWQVSNAVTRAALTKKWN